MTSKAALADYLKLLQKRHTAKYNCPLGKKRCSVCDLVAHTDKFIAQTAICRVCCGKRQKEYHECRVAARELATGEARKPRGRPKKVVVEEPVVRTRKKAAKV